MLAEVSAGPALLGQVQREPRRLEQSHAQRTFFWEQQQLFSFLVQKKKKKEKRSAPGTGFLPQSVLFPYFKEMNLSVHKGTEKFKDRQETSKKPVFSASALKWDTRGGDS